ncbi:MAG: YitT family protein [Bacilli bacterium]
MLFSSKKAEKSTTSNMNLEKLIIRYFILTVSLFISAIMFNLLQSPTHLISGGAGGIAIILEHLFDIRPALVIFIISVALLVLSFIFLGVEKTIGAIYATFLYPLFVEITSKMSIYMAIDTSDLLLISIIVGVIGGLTAGLNYKVGFSKGGLSIVSQILYKWKKWSVSKTSLIMNGLIVVVGGVFFGWTMVLYAIIIIFINSLVMDKVLLGISKTKAIYIITKEEDFVKDYIMHKLKQGVTVFNVQGGFALKKKHVLMTVIPTRDYFKLSAGVKEIDKSAFFVVIDAYQSSVENYILD